MPEERLRTVVRSMTFWGVQRAGTIMLQAPEAAHFLILVINEDDLDCWWVEDHKTGLATLHEYYVAIMAIWSLPLRCRIIPVDATWRVVDGRRLPG